MMMRRLLLIGLLAFAAPARASELFTGLLAHDIESPLNKGGFESGADIELGWRGDRIGALRFIGAPSPYAFASFATGGETHMAAAGLSWRIGHRLFARPGIGLAVHTRSSHGVRNGLRTDLGSRVLFEPELGIGYQLTDRVAIEASWVHVSHATLFGPQNPGMDGVGLRLSFALR
jgi:lipid A 3-O-deacylase